MAPKVKPEMNMTIKSILAATRPLAAMVAGLCMVLMAPTHASAEHLTRATKGHSEATIGGYARWNNNCDPIESPEIFLDVPPANGFLCVRTSTGTVRVVREGKAGHCAGRPIRGINLIYIPRSGFSGVDVIRYTVKFNVVKQTFDVDIGVQSNEAGNGAASSEAPQTQGPVPTCAPLVSYRRVIPLG
jgi:hypothetical protein